MDVVFDTMTYPHWQLQTSAVQDQNARQNTSALGWAKTKKRLPLLFLTEGQGHDGGGGSKGRRERESYGTSTEMRG